VNARRASSNKVGVARPSGGKYAAILPLMEEA